MTSVATLITGIGELTTNDDELGRMRDAALVVEGDAIAWVGDASAARSDSVAADERVDVAGRAVLPGWVDSHTHLVFAGDRTAEFEARMAGEAYAAGGIGVTVAATRAATDEALAANLDRLADEMLRGGTTAFETKTGYGLTVADELRSARIAAARADSVTFLGAHLVPEEWSVEGEHPGAYLDLVTGEMLAAVAPHVDAIDVFCERGAFDEAQSRRVLEAGRAAGLALRVHGNQLGPGPGVRLAVELGAASVDHVAFLDDDEVAMLADTWRGGAGTTPGTVATVLPACDLSTRMPLAPARRLVDAGAVVAIATNCNPGTSYTTSMAFCVATAVLQMGLTIEEAVRAATLGGAVALGLDGDEPATERHGAGRRGDGPGRDRDAAARGAARAHLPVGRIRPGARADLQVLEAPSITHLAYRPGVPLTGAVWRAGERAV